MKRYTARRLIAVFLGNILIGIGVAIFRMTLLGNDPSTAFVLSVAAKAGMALAATSSVTMAADRRIFVVFFFISCIILLSKWGGMSGGRRLRHTGTAL